MHDLNKAVKQRIEIVPPHSGDIYLTPRPDKYGNPGKVSLLMANGTIRGTLPATGDLIHGPSVNKDYLQACIKTGCLVKVGEFQSGNHFKTVLKWHDDLLKHSAAIGIIVDIGNRNFTDALNSMAEKQIETFKS